MPARRLLALLLAGFVALPGLLQGCASPVFGEAEAEAQAGRYEQAYAVLERALRQRPDDAALRTAHARARDRVVMRLLAQAELALAAGRVEEAQRVLERGRALDPSHIRLAALDLGVQRALRDETRLAQARRAADDGRLDEARTLADAVLRSQPGHAAARALRQQLRPAAPASTLPPPMARAYQRPVSLEFRDAPLRQVFETLSRTAGINFVFDKDLRADSRVTVFLSQVTLDEALRVILATQQLDRKLLNDSTLLVYPNTPAKQREHQELVTRSLYLVNADVKQAVALVRTMAKTRDVHADERLNALIVRDVPEVVAQIEKLVATIDLREPEVMMAVEVMEIGSDRAEELGLNWPTSIGYGTPNAGGELLLADRAGFRGFVANPALLLSLNGNSGSTNIIANPTIRARNREKAKVQIGEKLPVFTSTSTANVGVSTTVSYLDVGLKLEVEPTVQLDGEVTIKLALEVSNLLKTVPGPGGAIAYQVGTRTTTTSLRLRDGETQVLAGLVRDEDRQRTAGIPGLSESPLTRRLFGATNDKREKTEIVMLITPRIVHAAPLPDPAAATVASGTDAMPGQPTLRLAPQARAALPPAAGGGAPAAAAPAPDGALTLAATAEAGIGDTLSVTLSNGSPHRVEGELVYDPTLLELLSGKPGGEAGSVAVALGPRDQAVLVLRVLPGARGQDSVGLAVASLRATTANGESADLPVVGEATTRLRAPAGPR